MIAEVEITLDQHGKGTVILNGLNLSDCTTKIEVVGSFGETPRVTLELLAKVNVGGRLDLALANKLVDVTPIGADARERKKV